MPTTKFLIAKLPKSQSKSGLFGRELVARLAKLSNQEQDHFLKNSHKSFYFKDKNFFWSISHKDRWVAAAISKKPVGIDIEINRGKNKELFGVFTEAEWQILGRKTWANFYRGWTAKEAAIKAGSLRLADVRKILIFKRRGRNLLLSHSDKIMISAIYLKKGVTCSLAVQRYG